MKKIVVALCAVLLLSGLAYAQDLDSLVNEAKQSYQAQDKVGAAQKLKEAVLSIWDELPLTAVNARLNSDKNFTPKSDNVFASGEPMYVSAEILGAKIMKQGGIYKLSVACDFQFLDENGNVMFGKDDFGKFDVVSPMPNTEFYLNLTYKVTGAPKGKYKLQTVVRDLNSSKSTKFAKDIEIK